MRAGFARAERSARPQGAARAGEGARREGAPEDASPGGLAPPGSACATSRRPPRRRTRLSQQITVGLSVNGESHRRTIEPRLLLSDFIRAELGLTGTHVGCEHGVCGACTVLLDGEPVRSCLMFAVQAEGHDVRTVESLAESEAALHPLQAAFREAHGLQCGFCTPGILMTMVAFLREVPDPGPDQVRAALSGNLCRCTGYQNIVEAVLLAARSASPAP